MYIFVAIVVVIGIIIAIGVSMGKDSASVKSLQDTLSAAGFFTSDSIDVPDQYNENRPFHLLIDRQNKKWAFAHYRASTAQIYDYSDVVSYSLTIRNPGNDIVKGESRTVSVSDFGLNNSAGILRTQDVNSNNCEYISINVQYQGKALSDGIPSNFLLFEKQEGFTTARHKDFVVASASVACAKQIENIFYEIVRGNAV